MHISSSSQSSIADLKDVLAEGRLTGAPSALKQIVHKSSYLYSLFHSVIFNSVMEPYFSDLSSIILYNVLRTYMEEGDAVLIPFVGVYGKSKAFGLLECPPLVFVRQLNL